MEGPSNSKIPPAFNTIQSSWTSPDPRQSNVCPCLNRIAARNAKDSFFSFFLSFCGCCVNRPSARSNPPLDLIFLHGSHGWCSIEGFLFLLPNKTRNDFDPFSYKFVYGREMAILRYYPSTALALYPSSFVLPSFPLRKNWNGKIVNRYAADLWFSTRQFSNIYIRIYSCRFYSKVVYIQVRSWLPPLRSSHYFSKEALFIRDNTRIYYSKNLKFNSVITSLPTESTVDRRKNRSLEPRVKRSIFRAKNSQRKSHKIRSH